MSKRKSGEQFPDGYSRNSAKSNPTTEARLTGPTEEDRLLIELLADDELEEPQRRELLARLDSIPNGWRVLATAFLEAQCLVRALGEDKTAAAAEPFDRLTISALSAASAEEPQARAAGAFDRSSYGRSNDDSRSFHSRGGRPARHRFFLEAMAGGVLLAFLVSAAAVFLVRPVLGPRDGGVSLPSDKTNPLDSPLVADGTDGKPASDDPFDIPVQRVRLNTEANDLAGISLPCVESDHYDPALLHTPSTNEYLRELRRDGRQVDCTTEHLTIPLEDGRKAIVPVDTITIHYKDKSAPATVIYQ